MGVYIKDMKMPEGIGAVSVKIWPDGEAEIIDQDGNWETTKAVAVPPHGDLIERETTRDYWLNASWNNPKMDVGREEDVFAVINAVPTVIPAEEGELPICTEESPERMPPDGETPTAKWRKWNTFALPAKEENSDVE